MINVTQNKTTLPGSEGEHKMQEDHGTKDKTQDVYTRKMLDFLAEQMQDFTQRQEMVFISTSDKNSECDCSYLSGKKGYTQVKNSTILGHAELQGNGVIA